MPNEKSLLSLLAESVRSAYSETRYVVKGNSNAVPPYTNWANAAATIQDAVDAAAASDTIWVTNGVYEIGGRTANGALMNRVVIDKPLVVRSVNGPEVTVIKGAKPDGWDGYGAIRCVYLGTKATLIGFTLTNGCTSLDSDVNGYGGGIFLCAIGRSFQVRFDRQLCLLLWWWVIWRHALQLHTLGQLGGFLRLRLGRWVV